MSLTKILTGLIGSEPWARFITMFLVSAVILVVILVIVLYLILLLRKILGWIQGRIGPNRVGPWGLLQTVCDALKLFAKEDIIPRMADKWVYLLAPILVFVPSYMIYIVIPFSSGSNGIVKDLNIGVLYLTAISSIAIIGIITGAWASNNKYSLVGAFRSAAQMVGYEVPQVLAMLGPVMLAGTLRLQGIVGGQSPVWYIVLQPFGFLIYFTAILAETNIAPFDLVEGDSEIIAGFNTEYSGMKFAFFYLAEFTNNFATCAIAVTLFLGGWHGPAILPFIPIWFWGLFWFMVKTLFLVIVTMWIRGTLPRVRVDQLTDLGWKILIPTALINILLVALVEAAGWNRIILVAANFICLALLLGLGATWQAFKNRTTSSHAEVIHD